MCEGPFKGQLMSSCLHFDGNTHSFYHDYIVVFSSSSKQNIEHPRLVLALFRNAGLTMKLNECVFFSAIIDYFGHMIRPGNIGVPTQHREAIAGMQPPTNLNPLRYLLGPYNVLRRFVPNFARMDALLKKKLRRGEPFTFGELNQDELDALEALETSVVTPRTCPPT